MNYQAQKVCCNSEKNTIFARIFENFKKMNLLSNRLNALSESETLAMSQKSAELKAQGIDVINLSVGEPDFFTPDHITSFMYRLIDVDQNDRILDAACGSGAFLVKSMCNMIILKI